MKELEALLTNLKNNPRLASFSEDATKMAVVLPILRRIGWDTENIDEVTPEFSVESRRVDYALRLHNKCRVFIEVKKPSEDLDNESHQEQLLDYSFRQAVELAVLTNGVTWCLYLPRAGTDWRSRKFYTVDIVEQETPDVASKLVELLSKNNVQSGEALKRADEIHKGRLKKKAIENALPEAWNKVVTEPDSLLVDLLAEITERICGYKTELPDVAKFLKRNEARFLVLPSDEIPETQAPPKAGPRPRLGVVEPSGHQKVSQHALIPHIVEILKRHGGQAPKEQVEKEIFSRFRDTFERPWYQQTVSNGVPRWQHNLAWAKEAAKKQGLIKRPGESGRGIWALTDKGLRSY